MWPYHYVPHHNNMAFDSGSRGRRPNGQTAGLLQQNMFMGNGAPGSHQNGLFSHIQTIPHQGNNQSNAGSFPGFGPVGATQPFKQMNMERPPTSMFSLAQAASLRPAPALVKVIASKGVTIPVRAQPVKLDPDEPPPPQPVPLSSYAKFIPAPRADNSKAWAAHNDTPEPAEPAKQIYPQQHAQAQPDTPSVGGTSSPDQISNPTEFRRTHRREKSTGQVLRSSPLRNEVFGSDKMPSSKTNLESIKAQFDIQEWSPTRGHGPEDPTVLESVPTTPENLRPKPLPLEFKPLINAKNGQPVSYASMNSERGTGSVAVRPEACTPLSLAPTQIVNQVRLGASSQSDNGSKSEAQLRRGTVDRTFQFPSKPPGLGERPNMQYPLPSYATPPVSLQGGFIPQPKTPVFPSPFTSQNRYQSQHNMLQTPPATANSFRAQRETNLQPPSTPAPYHLLGRMAQDRFPAQRQSPWSYQSPYKAGIEAVQRPVAPLSQIQSQPSVTGENSYQAQREILLKSLQGVAASGSARAGAARTVLHDPHRESPTKEPFPEFNPSTTSSEHLHESGHPLDGPTEPLPWKERRTDIFTIVTPGTTDDEIRVASNARIAQVKEEEALSQFSKHATKVSAELALELAELWWRNKDQERDELRIYVQNVANKVIDYVQQQRNAGHPACLKGNLGNDRLENSAIHLFVPLLCNVHTYLAESPYKGRGMFGNFKQPPEWCVDTSPQGLNSFFGEDWGAPPERVSRDRRYRTETPRPGHALYETPITDRWM